MKTQQNPGSVELGESLWRGLALSPESVGCAGSQVWLTLSDAFDFILLTVAFLPPSVEGEVSLLNSSQMTLDSYFVEIIEAITCGILQVLDNFVN